MMHNPELEWRKLDERTVEVATRVAGERLPVRMELDESGDIVRTSSHARLLKLGRVWRATPWAGEFRNYAIVESMRIPTEAEVYWELEDGRFVYWHGIVTGAELLGQGAMRPAWR